MKEAGRLSLLRLDWFSAQAEAEAEAETEAMASMLMVNKWG